MEQEAVGTLRFERDTLKRTLTNLESRLADANKKEASRTVELQTLRLASTRECEELRRQATSGAEEVTALRRSCDALRSEVASRGEADTAARSAMARDVENLRGENAALEEERAQLQDALRRVAMDSDAARLKSVEDMQQLQAVVLELRAAADRRDADVQLLEQVRRCRLRSRLDRSTHCLRSLRRLCGRSTPKQ